MGETFNRLVLRLSPHYGSIRRKNRNRKNSRNRKKNPRNNP
jgi:hypothetical protein